ncbi:ABC transporter ATP-binding protein [Synechococcus sp. BA-120 BA3]|nr:ABC transporter ATP-binding protein [Synechococcus sp. BA-120 BA3]
MSSDVTPPKASTHNDHHPIIVSDLGKCYQIYAKPTDRLKQALWRGRRNYYREFWALRNVNLEVRRGETLAIIGRNGSGKSTLLQMICGTLAPTEGSIRTSGTIAALLELGSGFNPEFTGIENVFLNASLLGLTQEQTSARLDDIQAFADIGDFVHQPVKTYSSGMLVRLAFAVVAHVDPSVLIVDEALSVGDAVFGQRCMRFIRRFTEKGTLLFVSHDLNAVSSLCERAIWIDSGRVQMDADTAPIITAYTRSCHEASNAEIDLADRLTDVHSFAHGASSENASSGLTTEHKSKTIIIQRDGASTQGSDPGEDIQAGMADWDAERDYGDGRATIINVVMRDKNGVITTTPKCGESIKLEISVRSNAFVERFLVGFFVRDRTGQIVFAESTADRESLAVEGNKIVAVSFEFVMPFLRAESYSLSTAVSNGEMAGYKVLHFKPDTLFFQPMLGRVQVSGVFALTKVGIELDVQDNQ